MHIVTADMDFVLVVVEIASWVVVSHTMVALTNCRTHRDEGMSLIAVDTPALR